MTLDNQRMEQAFRFSLPFSTLPASVLKGSYDLIPTVFSKIALRAMVENEIGSKSLDRSVSTFPIPRNIPASGLMASALCISYPAMFPPWQP